VVLNERDMMIVEDSLSQFISMYISMVPQEVFPSDEDREKMRAILNFIKGAFLLKKQLESLGIEVDDPT
jgi:hypothetical protein